MNYLDKIQMSLRSVGGDTLNIHINVYDNNLSQKWLASLNHLIKNDFHLEKNYCWFGFTESPRTVEYICQCINNSIDHINQTSLGYYINDFFSIENTIASDLGIEHAKLNQLHRYFEDLQGVSGAMSPYYTAADDATRWHIRQLNLLCHELESLILGKRRVLRAPEWRRPSQLMCWLNAPRFMLEPQDYELFGIDTLNRDLGGVYVGVNKAIGKHHWEVFNDEGRDSRVTELTTTSLRSQTEAAGDFDIEWGRNPTGLPWQDNLILDFRSWLSENGFDPNDKSLTIGHPQVAQVDLYQSFGTEYYSDIWSMLGTHLNVCKIQTSDYSASYEYDWSDTDYMQRQINVLRRN